MLVGKRRLGTTLLERHIVYDLMADGSPTGFIEYSADRDWLEIRGQGYSIVSERKPMTLLEQAVKLLTWRWKDVFAFGDDARRLIATAEKSALNTFSLHHEGAAFFRIPRAGHVRNGVIAAIGMGALDPGFLDVDTPFLC
jgi:hypothetical protein